MSIWTDNFEKLNPLGSLVETYEIAKTINLDGLSDDNREKCTRILKVLPILIKRFQKIDPDFYHQNTWNQINSWVVNSRDQMRAFSQNKNIGHINNVNTHLDELLQFFRPFDYLVEVSDVEALRLSVGAEQQTLENSAKELKNKLVQMQNETSQLASKSKEVSAGFDNQKVRADQIINEFQKQFSETQQARLSEFGKQVSNFTQKLDTELKGSQSKFDQFFSDSKAEHKKLLSDFKDSAMDSLKELEANEDKAKKIVNVIGNVGVTGDYKKAADDEREQANNFRLGALGLMVVGAGLAVWAFIDSINNAGLDWKVFLMRISTSIFIFAPSLYCGKESSRHRNLERFNRKQQLELESIDAYLALMPEDQRNKLKSELVPKFFGQNDPVDVSDEVTKVALFSTLKEAMKMLSKNK